MTNDEAAVAEMVAKDAAVTVKLLMRYRDEWDQDDAEPDARREQGAA